MSLTLYSIISKCHFLLSSFPKLKKNCVTEVASCVSMVRTAATLAIADANGSDTGGGWHDARQLHLEHEQVMVARRASLGHEEGCGLWFKRWLWIWWLCGDYLWGGEGEKRISEWCWLGEGGFVRCLFVRWILEWWCNSRFVEFEQFSFIFASISSWCHFFFFYACLFKLVPLSYNACKIFIFFNRNVGYLIFF